ncbi:MAG: hypothetical protein K9G11_04760 [Rickettsiaceae bacterium]|nr:hypothetical protein [Rickettsiaceae bacterium]
MNAWKVIDLRHHELVPTSTSVVIQLLNLSFKYVWKESFILDCHALQARNDASTLPLEDVASFIIESLECL